MPSEPNKPDFVEVPEKIYIDDPISAYFAIRGNYFGGEGGEGGSGGGSQEAAIPFNVSDNPQDGQVLAYNASTGKWENANIPESIPSGVNNPQNGQVLVYDSATGTWVNGSAPETIPSAVTSPQNGQTLIYDSATGKWKNANAPESIPSAVSNPQNGQALVYNSTTGKWENAAITHECVVKVLTPTVSQGTGEQEGYILYTINESYSSLLAYINEGKLVFIKYTDNNGTHVRPLTDLAYNEMASSNGYSAKVGGESEGNEFLASTANANMMWAYLEDKYKNIVDVGQVDYMRLVDVPR